ncbi:hypothetical protein [Lysinibacillus pakistanensis]|uniref:hypothetical protein n=1 Tax=Lysinibacillus pakistanensis TaxID=759811 RepID=UPI0034E4D620
MKSLLENISLLENVYELSMAVLLLCSLFSVRLFKKLKRERKLSVFEFTMYMLIRISIFLWLTSFLLIRYGTYLPLNF